MPKSRPAAGCSRRWRGGRRAARRSSRDRARCRRDSRCAGSPLAQASASAAAPRARCRARRRLVGRVEQIGQRLRIALGRPRAWHCGTAPAPPASPPRARSWCEALAEERAERLVFPGLDVARRPVVEQAEPGDVARPRRSGSACRARCPGRSRRRARARSRGCARGRSSAASAARLALAVRAAHRGAAARSTRRGRDSRSAPICSSAAADCRGGTACRRWSRGGCRRRSRCSRRSRPAAAGGTPRRDAGARDAAPRPRAPHRRRAARRARRAAPPRLAPSAMSSGLSAAPARRRALRGSRRRTARLERRGEIEDLVADRDAAAGRAAGRREHAERQVLDREVGVPVGRGDPACAPSGRRSVVELSMPAGSRLSTAFWLDRSACAALPASR